MNEGEGVTYKPNILLIAYKYFKGECYRPRSQYEQKKKKNYDDKMCYYSIVFSFFQIQSYEMLTENLRAHNNVIKVQQDNFIIIKV